MLILYYHLNLEEHCTLHYYEYDQISGLPDVYEQIFDEYDGFCVTGNTSRLVIQMQCPDKKKPIRSISAKSAEYYKEFFFLINEHRDLSLGRVALDSYYWMKERGPSNIPEFIDRTGVLRISKKMLWRIFHWNGFSRRNEPSWREQRKRGKRAVSIWWSAAFPRHFQHYRGRGFQRHLSIRPAIP